MVKDPLANTYKWLLVKQIHGCHKIFRDERTGRYSICDYSGSRPHLTDDGVLWINQERPLVHTEGKWSIPLLDKDGKKTSTLANDDEARWLIETMKMDIEVGGNLFQAGGKIPMIPRKDNVGDVCTSHITLQDSLSLDKGGQPYQIGNFEYGHVVLTFPKSDKVKTGAVKAAGFSAAYVRLLHTAYAQGYYYLMIDRDGPVIDGLDTFEW